MGQPMSSSYENRWLSAGDENKKGSPLVGRRKSITTEENKSSPLSNKENNTKKGKEGGKPHNPNEPPKKAQKDMTKAERRAMQDKQRLEKQNRIAAGLPKSAKQAAELEVKKPTTNANPSNENDANKQKKKTVSKNQQNQVPWLLHLDVPKVSESLTKDLHPAVLQLGLYFSEHKIVGSNARCVAMLEIFSKVKKMYFAFLLRLY
jgi:translation initiation factor eIF-2B subunit delta